MMAANGTSSALTTFRALALASFFATASVAAQDLEPSKIDVSQLGPQVGEQIPDFSLPDQFGEVWTRESIMGENGAMLVFIRSADW
jgi:hypothetical protein